MLNSKHIVISISGKANSGKSSVATVIGDCLTELGLTANVIPMYPEKEIESQVAHETLGNLISKGRAPVIEILDGVRNAGVEELRTYVERLDDSLSLLGVITHLTPAGEKEAARKTAVALHCQKLSIPLALGTYYLKEVYPKRGFKDAVE